MDNVKKVAIFGGTGMTGICALDVALQLGLKVKLLLRDSSRLPEDYHDKVEIIHGNVINCEDVEKTVSDVDGVVVALGTRNNLEPTTDLSRGMDNIISAIKKKSSSIPVSICLSSFLFFKKGTVPPMFAHINAEHERMLKSIESSGLNYIAVLPPHIADEPKSEYLIENGKSPGGRIVSKYELAEFLVTCLNDRQHYCKQLGICSKSSVGNMGQHNK